MTRAICCKQSSITNQLIALADRGRYLPMIIRPFASERCNTATCCRNGETNLIQSVFTPSHANFIQNSNVDFELDLHSILLCVRRDVSMLELNIGNMHLWSFFCDSMLMFMGWAVGENPLKRIVMRGFVQLLRLKTSLHEYDWLLIG